ncbi:MAG: hypothetical protein QOF02_4199 [Blastocatellia bacterium]|nr:hypothetical protein [Blastocatellia bacterium]
MKMKRTLLLALVAAGLLLSVAPGSTAQNSEELREEFHRTFPLAADGRVTLSTISGAVKVTTWERNEIKIDAVKRAYSRERLDEAQIKINANANSIDIDTDYPERNYTFNKSDERRNSLASVDYILTVPRGASIESIELVNGDLSVEGLTGDVKASLVNGQVTARGLVGEAKLSTVNGRLEATFDRLSPDKAISLGSVNGPLAVTIPSDSNAQVRANTVHGSITNDFGLRVRHGEYVGSDLAGTLGSGGPRIKLANVNGPITIRHASDGRTLSPATNQLPESGRDNDDDAEENDDGSDAAARDARQEGRRVAREAAREASRAQIEAQRVARDTQREGARAARAAQVDAAREAQQERIEAQREEREASIEAQREARAALQENAQAIGAAQRDAERAVRASQREVARASREAARIARDAARADYASDSNDLRLVERESKSFPVSGAPRLTLNTFDGRISIRSWDKPEVMLTAIKRAGNEQSLRGITVKAEQQGTGISVQTDYDKAASRLTDGVRYTNASVTLELLVPRNTNIIATSGDGRVEIEGVTGSVTAQTGDGRIEVRDGGGQLTAKTNDGRIEVVDFNGQVDVKTNDGRINLDGRFAQLTARTGSGSIMLSVPTDQDATLETDAESVTGDGITLEEEAGAGKKLRRFRIGRGGAVFHLNTGEGSVFLRRR